MLRYIGDFSQLFGIKEYVHTGGKAKGVKAFDVENGSGLEFTVHADRCLYIDALDNYLYESIGKLPVIEKDEEVLHLLVSDYNKFV